MSEYKLTVTSKGQVTLPVDYRRTAGIETGSVLTFVTDPKGRGYIQRRLSLDEIAGSLTSGLTKQQRNFTQADIEASIDEAMDEQDKRAAMARP